MINPRNEIYNLTEYIPGKNPETLKREKCIDKIVKLASNENPIGSSPMALKNVYEYLKSGLNIYPDGASYELRKKLATKYKLGMENILITNGGDEAISIVASTFLNSQCDVIISNLTFKRYTDSSLLQGANIINVDLKDFTYDLTKILNSITANTKLIYLTNPNNPTGTILSQEALFNFFDKIPKDILILYDEAYGEYVDDDNFPKDSRHFFTKYKNVITLKTFSKIYGLAALRIGYITATKPLIEYMNKVRPPFNVNALGQVAAIGAIDDDEFLAKSHKTNLLEKKFLYNEFDKLNISYIKTQANHILIYSDKYDGNTLTSKLEDKGVIVRSFNKYVRVTIGTHDENEFFIKILKDILNN